MTADLPKIPLHRSTLDESDVQAVADLLRSGSLASDGAWTKRAQALLAERFGLRHVLLVTSATHALELAMMALGVRAGDEVILPSFTFTSVATSIVRAGATPVFAEITEPALTLDVGDVERRITGKTRAILLAHYAGVGMDNSALLDLAHERGIPVVEDAAQCVGARYRGTWLGGFGDAACYSFHYTKNITCGEGGAFVTNRSDLARKAEIHREKGTDRSRFLRGEVDKYRWMDEGSSYVPSEIQSALLCSQIDKLDGITQNRRQLFDRYLDRLAAHAGPETFRLPHVPEGSEPNGHLLYLLLRDGDLRNEVLCTLRDQGIGSTFHYVPLHSSPYASKRWGYRAEELPVTESVCSRLLRLPIYAGLTEAEQDRVIESFVDTVRRLA